MFIKNLVLTTFLIHEGFTAPTIDRRQIDVGDIADALSALGSLGDMGSGSSGSGSSSLGSAYSGTLPTGGLGSLGGQGFALPSGLSFPNLPTLGADSARRARHRRQVDGVALPTGFPIPISELPIPLSELPIPLTGLTLPTGLPKERRDFSLPSGVAFPTGLPFALSDLPFPLTGLSLPTDLPKNRRQIDGDDLVLPSGVALPSGIPSILPFPTGLPTPKIDSRAIAGKKARRQALVARDDSTQNDVTDNASCKPLTVIFARGTMEGGNVGTVAGPPMFAALKKSLGDGQVNVQGVTYDASIMVCYTLSP